MKEGAVPEGHRLKSCRDCERQFMVLSGDDEDRCPSCLMEDGELEPDIHNNRNRKT